MKNKAKFHLGQTVYCRPSVVSGNGMIVYKCKVVEVNLMAGGHHYYSLIGIDKEVHLFVKYENEMSKRPERLIREAKEEVEYNYSGYVQAYNNYIEELNKLLNKNAG